MSVERGYRSYIDLVLTVTSTLCTWGVVRNHKLKQYKTIKTSMNTGLNLCISTNVKNSKTSEFEFYKTWREKRQNKQDIIWQICLQFNIIVNRVVYAFNTKLLILTVVWHEYDGGCVLKVMGGFTKNCAMDDLCLRRRVKNFKFTWPTPPPLLFNAKFYLILVEYQHLIR